MSVSTTSNFNILAGAPIDTRMTKATIADRDAIPASQRYEGMEVYVVADGTKYRLIGGTANANWSLKHDKLLVRSDTEANWLEADPILNAGEPAYVTDKRMTKHGDGVHPFSELKYDYSYESDVPVTTNIGGYSKGDALPNTDIVSVIDTLLHPYAAPICKTFTVNPGAATKSAGSPIASATITLKVELGSRTISKAEFLLDNTVKVTVTEGTSTTSGGVTTVTYTGTYSTSTGSANTTGAASDRKWTARVTDSQGQVTTFTNSVVWKFVGPTYVGAVNNGTTINTANVTALAANNWITSNFSGANGVAKLTYSGANKQLVIAYPAAFGNIKNVFDQNAFDITSTFSHTSTITVPLNGADVSYKVYYTDNIAAENTNFTVYFKL